MNNLNSRYILIFIFLLITFCRPSSIGAQNNNEKKKITPVEVDDKKPRQPTLHYYDKHGQPLEEPVLFLAELDTVVTPKAKPVYPLFNGVSVGVNFADAILTIAGQKHRSFDIWADVSLHNWFFPVLEAGIGFADNKPQNGNFRYQGKPSAYLKAGINYNFLYKSNPDYQIFFGLRGCWSTFRYDITDITVNSEFWEQTQSFSIMNQKATSIYGEALIGIKVRLGGSFSLGWTVRYHTKFKNWNPEDSNPWFVPGYGTKSPLNLSFSAIWTFGRKTLIRDMESEESK